MSWPLSHEFNEAVQSPRVSFSDPDLRCGSVEPGPAGVPLPRSGNFADVYQLRGADGRVWAVKCFTRPVPGLGARYAKVAAALDAAGLPFAVPFRFLGEGIRVSGAWRPVVKMEWVEGPLLNQVARDAAAKPAVLGALGAVWARLCGRLRDAGLAHGDLQHGNVLLVPGARPGSYGLRLIDYDGLWAPALAGEPPGESGHPSFQHPARARDGEYSAHVDRFPLLVVGAALRGLAAGGRGLWDRYDDGDNLLFSARDFRDPSRSPVMRALWTLGDPGAQALVGHLAVACGRPLRDTPWFDRVAPDGEPGPLDPAVRRAAADALGLGLPLPVHLPPAHDPFALPPEPGTVSEPPLPISFEWVADPGAGATAAPARGAGFEVVEGRARPRAEAERIVVEVEPVPLRARRKGAGRAKEAGRSRPKRHGLWLGGAALGLLVLVGGVVVVLTPRNRPGPSETVQQNPKGPSDTAPVPVAIPSQGPPPVPIVPKSKPKPKETSKEPDPPPVMPKDPPPAAGPVVLKSLWHVSADSGGAPAVLHADTETVFVGGPRGTLLALDPATGAKRPAPLWLPLTGGDHFCPLAAGRVAWCGPDEDDVRTWDARTGRVGEKVPVPAVPPGAGWARHTFLRLSPDGKYLVVARAAHVPCASEKVPFHVFATDRSGRVAVRTDWFGGSAHFTADSSRVLVAELGGRFRWFDLASGEVAGEWDYSPSDDERAHVVASATADGGVIGYTGPARFATGSGPCLVDGKTGDVLHRFGPGYAENSPVVLAAGGRVAALLREPDGDGWTIDVVSVPQGAPLARATTAGAVPTFALAPDGRALFAHEPKAGTLWKFAVP